MKRRRLEIFAAISIAMIAILAIGFTGRFGVLMNKSAVIGGQPYTREVTAALDEGRALVWVETWRGINPPTTAPARPVRFLASVHLRFDLFHHALGSFDAHPLAGPGGSQLYLLACPIWFLMLPFLIAPAAWIFRRQRLPKHGFDITTTEPSTITGGPSPSS